MRVLLDTNIIIHREADKISNASIGVLFFWLDKLRMDKCIHPITVVELSRYNNAAAVGVMNVKLNNYHSLKTEAPISNPVQDIIDNFDANENDVNDTKILNEVYENRVDLLISEDKKIHRKAQILNISDRVFKIDDYLELVISENPDLVDYRVLAVRKEYFGGLNLNDSFFDSFRDDYQEFNRWFNRKSDEIAYVCYDDRSLVAFLYIKTESDQENYTDIVPPFSPKRRLKIGTFKVTANGYKLGERFLKIIFDNAQLNNVDEIYVTIFDRNSDQLRLIELLESWGFHSHGVKNTVNGSERVFVKPLRVQPNLLNPKLTFPEFSSTSDVYIVPIYPAYHTELFPDSILRTESPNDFVENYPHRNALSKVYISRSYFRNMQAGDLIVFYRTGGYHLSVATTIGIVESVVINIANEDDFIRLCKKRSVFTDDQLREHWNFSANKPFIVNFLYLESLKRRPNLKWLIDNQVISGVHNAPRGFSRISRENFDNIVKYSRT